MILRRFGPNGKVLVEIEIQDETISDALAWPIKMDALIRLLDCLDELDFGTKPKTGEAL